MQSLYYILTQQVYCPNFSNTWPVTFTGLDLKAKFEVSVIYFLCGIPATSWGNTSWFTTQVVKG